MFYKICAGICAVSTVVTASVCVWFVVWMHKLDEAGREAIKSETMTDNRTMDAELANEMAAIDKRINSSKMPVLPSPGPASRSDFTLTPIPRPVTGSVWWPESQPYPPGVVPGR